MDQELRQKVEDALEQAKVRTPFWPEIFRGVEALSYEPAGVVVLTDEHRRAFREMGRTPKDLDDFLKNNVSGEVDAIVSNAKGISAVWCFEDLGDAAMFKLTYGIA